MTAIARAAVKVAPKSATAKVGSKADASKKAVKKNADVDLDAEDAEAAAAAAAIAAAQEEAHKAAVADLTGKMRDTLRDLQDADKQSALEARVKWVSIGRLLIEGRSVFVAPASNKVDDKAFGKWIIESGFTAIGQRPTRSAAIWLAQVYDLKPGLYNLFPTESVNGDPLRRSPRTLQSWVREQMVQVFQDAWESDSDAIDVASDADGDTEAKRNIALSTLPNVYDALMEQVDAASSALDKSRDDLSKATQANRAAAMADFASKSDVYEAIVLRKKIFDEHDDGERADLFAQWKPKRTVLAFKDCDVDTAADRLFALLKAHPEFSAVYASLGELVTELQSKVSADLGAVDAVDGGDDDGDDLLDDDDIEIEDEDGDDFEEEEVEEEEEEEDFPA